MFLLGLTAGIYDGEYDEPEEPSHPVRIPLIWLMVMEGLGQEREIDPPTPIPVEDNWWWYRRRIRG
jgi:hypothetical protein